MEPVVKLGSGRGVDTKSQDVQAERGGVQTSSDTIQKLRDGLVLIKEQAAQRKQAWDEKVEHSKKHYICKKCSKPFVSESGIKRHWSAKGNDCTSDDGYTVESDIEPSIQDKVGEKQLSLASKLADAQKAAREVANRLKGGRIAEDGLNPNRLMRYPIGNFERALKQATTTVLEEFVAMRFDRSTAPKKVMAEKELSLRRKKA